MIRNHECQEAAVATPVYGSHTESAAPGKVGRGRRILVVGRDPVARGFLAVVCEANGFLVDEAEMASSTRLYREIGPFFACTVGVRPFFTRCATLLRELGATRMETLVVIVGEASDKAPAELETTEAVTILVRPFEDEAIIRVLKGLLGGRLAC